MVRLDVDHDPALFPDGVLTLPRTLELRLAIGAQGYPGTIALDEDELDIKGNHWKARP